MSVVPLREGQTEHFNDPNQIDLEDLTSRREMKVHPAAEVFPMLDEDALNELADDIRENGLRVPIVVDQHGTLIDGRNRLAACRKAGVQPRFDTFEGDPRSFIVSLNINRRHLSVGQQAMAYAVVFPEAAKGNPGLPEGIKKQTIYKARVVARSAPDLVASVMAGSSLKEAFEEAISREQAANSVEGRLSTLRSNAPDLAEKVSQETLTFEEAWGAYQARLKEQREREELRRQQRATATLNLAKVLMHLVPPGSKREPKRVDDRVSEWMSEIDLDQWPREISVAPDVETLRLAVRSLQQILAHFNDGVIDG